MTPRVPAQALEAARQKLEAFRTRSLKLEWKAFDLVNANEDSMSFESVGKFEAKLVTIMEKKVRLPCIVCQVHQDVIYCSITFTSNLTLKERISHSRFKPTFFCVMFPNESVFYSTRATIPEVIGDSLLKLYGATRLNQLPLVGRDFRSLRQLHLNKENKGMIRRRPVEDSHPIDTDVEMSETSDDGSDVIQDEDKPWRKKKDKYYRRHFYPEKDPVITKFKVSSSTKFSSGTRSSKKLNCNMEVIIQSDNLINFFNDSMDKGIMSYPLNPALQNIANLGCTSISLNTEEN